MIFNVFDPNQDVVSGRTNRVASGFWPTNLATWSQSYFVDDFWSLTGSVGNPSFGTSFFDVRRTMYYENVFPSTIYQSNSDPYFSLAYGNVNGDIGSGSFSLETASIDCSPTKAIYTQYSNMLLDPVTLDSVFTMLSASSNISASDIWIIDFSAYKMKDQIDPGLLEFTLSGSGTIGQMTFIDDSPYTNQNQNVYQIISGSLSNPPLSPTYNGLGLFYPSNGVIILNASVMATTLGLPTYPSGIGNDGAGPGTNGTWPYNPGLETSASFTYNQRVIYWALTLSNSTFKVRKSEFVPATHYFVRVMNRDFNYSNNPTYVYDGTDGVHSKGTIYNSDFITNPRTYITSVGLYNDNNELVAVAKLSRPAYKDYSSELLLRVRLDY